MNHSLNRRRALALGVPAVLLSLTACGLGSGSDAISTIDASVNPAGATRSAQAPVSSSAGSSTASSTASSAGSSAGPSGGTGKGCTSGEAQVPRGAHSAKTADLDGDGKADRIWLRDEITAKTTERSIGVTFAAGGGSSTTFDSAAPQSATAVAGRIHGGGAMLLLDTGRSVQLYTVAGCTLVPSLNKQGGQYTFDKGFTGFGTGVGCPVLGSSGRQLVGYLAKADSTGKHYQVTRTTIDISDGGRRAANGTTVSLGSRLSPDSEPVRTAFQVACGPSGQAKEGGY